jgi:thiol:disulfide interchange protein DsbD
MQSKIARCFIFILIISAGLFSLRSFAFSTVTPLPADQAFIFSASFSRQAEVLAQWQIAPGYYLYQKKLLITFPANVNAKITYPQGEFRFDQARGRFEAYTGVINAPIQLQAKDQATQMSVDYQGCSEGGFCYPPIHKEFLVNVAGQSIAELSDAVPTSKSEQSISALITDQNGVRDLLAASHFGVLLLIFAGLGLLLAFTPCVLPMIPILTGIIVGHTQPLSARKAFFLSSSYVLGSAITYAFAGVAAALMGSSLQAGLQQPWIIALTGGLFVLLALSLFGLFDITLPRSWQLYITTVSRKQRGGTYVGAFIMGVVSTLIVSPCVTAPLVGVLMYIGQTGNVVLGAAALFAMGMGMGLPLLLIGVSARKVLPKSGPWMILVKQLFGVLMLGMAVWMLSRIASPTTLMMSVGIVLLGLSLFFCLHLARRAERGQIHRLIGYVTGLSGIILLAGGLGAPGFVNNWVHNGSTTSGSGTFIIVRNINDLNQQLTLAQAAHKPVLLDFYADWCESCVSMDKKVFSAPQVEAALSNFVLLRADLSANNTADETILKNYAVVAPPTVLFFNNNGREVNSRRIVGEINEQEFIGRVNTFMSASCDKKLQC